MNKQITSILLVAGTSIGAGMIALPMSLAKLGVIPSLAIMFATWFLTYYSSLVSVELNLHSDRGLSLGLMGRKFSGRGAEIVGEVSVKLLSYALLSAYIYGSSSIIQKLINIEISAITIQTILSIAIIIALLFPTHIVSKINNIAFTGFIGLFILLIVKVVSCVDYTKIPWFVAPNLENISSIVTIVLTSFGYQVIFHTLRDYCGKDVKMLKRAFFYGSIIPMVVYMLWISGVLGVIYKSNREFFELMLIGKIEVGDLVQELSGIFKSSGLQIMIWWLSIFTILTSIIGVGLGLVEAFNLRLHRTKFSNIISALLTVAPAYFVAAVTPNAFLKTLSSAGSILFVIAILLPTYLFFKAKFQYQYLLILKKPILLICVIIGLAIMLREFP